MPGRNQQKARFAELLYQVDRPALKQALLALPLYPAEPKSTYGARTCEVAWSMRGRYGRPLPKPIDGAEERGGGRSAPWRCSPVLLGLPNFLHVLGHRGRGGAPSNLGVLFQVPSPMLSGRPAAPVGRGATIDPMKKNTRQSSQDPTDSRRLASIQQTHCFCTSTLHVASSHRFLGRLLHNQASTPNPSTCPSEIAPAARREPSIPQLMRPVRAQGWCWVARLPCGQGSLGRQSRRAPDMPYSHSTRARRDLPVARKLRE